MAGLTKTNRGIDRVSLAVILSAAAAIGYEYTYMVNLPNRYACMKLHTQIIERQSDAPYRYRVLVPYVMQGFIYAGLPFMSYTRAFNIVYASYAVGACFLLLWMLFMYVRLWFTREQTLIGVLFVASTIFVPFFDHYFQPWSLLEPALYAAALLAIHDRRYYRLAVLTLLASLNRETGVFLPLLFLLVGIGRLSAIKANPSVLRGVVLRFLGYISIWAAVFVGLRVGLALPNR